MKTKIIYNVDLRSRKTGDSVLTILKTENHSEAWNLADKTNQAWFQNLGVYSSATPTDSWIDGSEGYFADVIETEEEITMKDTRETIITKGLEKAVETWRDSDGDYSAYELIDEFFTALDFPVNYVNREEGDWDILSVAFLTEDNKIDFIKFTF